VGGDPGIKLSRAQFMLTNFLYFFIPNCCWSPDVVAGRLTSNTIIDLFSIFLINASYQ